ncbi:CHAP domain-containing protein [Actinoplanes flavus]|uniref:CHAP domain-containing protein n=1 Tax=Actinoplanes flavus TaxID=2820290 RepID=A0ABS3UL49_9ACTN|nr:CHAP domain-containing protein [Actinoplanes flavus]MBO3739510.1 CHAP domain-containing protein [Actinoplanes flavus]
MNMRTRLASVLLAAPLMLGSVAVTTAATSTPVFADAACSSNVSVYGTLADGRLTYTVLDPDNGNVIKVVTSAATLGFTPKALATLNFNTLLITSTGGQLYRVDISTNNTSLTFNTPVALGGGWTHDQLAYDGHGHLYGIADGTLLQYVVSGTKPTSGQVGMRKEIGTGFTLKTLTAVGDDTLAGTTSSGELLNYKIDASGGWTRIELLSSGWSAFSDLLSPGGGLYFGKMPDGSMYWYEDQNPNNNHGGDITYHLDDPVSSRGWTQTLLSAQPATCTVKAPENTLGANIARIAIGELGTTETDCQKYGAGCGDIAWCAMFAKWVWREAGVTGLPSTNFARGLGDWGVDKGLFKYRSGSGNGNPKVGDWVIYGSPANAGGGHVQIITKVHSDGRITIVGGNQSNKVTTYTVNPANARSGSDNLPISGYVSPPGA